MQNRGALWVFTILLAIACLWQISFSIFTGRLESKAEGIAAQQADSVLAVAGNGALDRDSIQLSFENAYLRDHNEEQVHPFGYSYKYCKEREMSMGLDLKGGMAVTLEVSIPELVDNLSGENQDPAFRAALAAARKRQLTDSKDYITLFDEEFRKAAPNGSLAAIFSSQDNTSIFPRESTNEQVIKTLRDQAQAALNNTEIIMRARIDQFGVAQPIIQKQALSGRIQIELPGVKDKARVRRVLQSTANLEFWETFDNEQVYTKLIESNTKLSALLHPELAKADSATAAADSTRNDSLIAQAADTLKKDSLDVDSLADAAAAADTTKADTTEMSREEVLKRNPLLGRLQLNIADNQVIRGDVVGMAATKDTAEVNRLLALAPPQSPDPSQGLKLAWGRKGQRFDLPEGGSVEMFSLHALRTPRNGKPKLDGSVVVDARQDYDIKGDAEVAMQMNSEGAQTWKRMTGENVGKQIAIVLDGYVVSAPNVIGEIPGGRSSISMGGGDRNAQIDEAVDLANVLNAGALPAPARIIDETVVGPSLGAENVDKGLVSFAVSLVGVLLVMGLYYNRAGWIADIALLANVFFLIGTMASLQAVLTLPGIAGIVLTIGMAVDANVLINERVRDELKQGRALKSAIDTAYSNSGALSAIIDSNVTTLITAVILFYFGSGPIRGFATTLGLGILTSLFTAIFISRLVMNNRLEKGKSISFSRPWNVNLFQGANYNFMGKRKVFYAASIIMAVICIGSMATRGFNWGVDFSGGRAYTIQFQNDVEAEAVRSALEAGLIEEGKDVSTSAKTYGSNKRFKVTTNYLIEDMTQGVDQRVEAKLTESLAALGNPYRIEESRKVDATISDDIKTGALTAVGVALIFMFLYIAVRFRRWEFGFGAVMSLVHDTIFILGLYSILWGVVGFSLEIDEVFIAVILTVIGYSINDTVVVFDRIRDYVTDHKREPVMTIFNKAINSTLSRTLNTGVCTMLVLLIIFFFGGISIKGFVFGLFAGVLTGTYSSIFIASAIAADIYKKEDKALVPQQKAVVA
ncbi:MAG TPA: protein translocase subunit SecDF [Flavobacteriales bacterium]